MPKLDRIEARARSIWAQNQQFFKPEHRKPWEDASHLTQDGYRARAHRELSK